MTFKEINWQMIRIEADATQSSHLEIMCAPVRLITNQSKIRVTLKRRVSKMVFWLRLIADRVSRRVRGAQTVLAGEGGCGVIRRLCL